MVGFNVPSTWSCEKTKIFLSVTVTLVNDMFRYYMTHSTQIWWGGTSTMMTRARRSYSYRYTGILRCYLASFVVSLLMSSNIWG